MEKLKLTYSFEGSVANIVLFNGKGNIIDNGMMLELMDLMGEFKFRKDLKLITFRGEGKHFSFGASVEEHVKELAPVMLKNFHSLFLGLADLSVPTLAKISGQCLGGGMELALVCNFLFAERNAVLGQPEIVLGVFPPPASLMLPMKIGNAKAEELLLTGRNISAEEAERIGLVNKVFDDNDSMEQAVDGWIEKNILPKSALALKFGVKSSRTVFNEILRKELPLLEKMYIDKLMESKDANEGISSFMEKRNPVWENC